jgi:uncharacterized protein with predicted RNA binding PUA domain
LKPLPLNPRNKLINHLSVLFDTKVDEEFPSEIQCEFSKRTGRIKNFFIGSNLFATLRIDGGLAISIFGAKMMVKYAQFRENCVIPKEEAIPFVSEGRSLFCKHVKWCGKNVKNGSDVVVIDNINEVLAVGKAICGNNMMEKYDSGVAVKIREGIKSRNIQQYQR